MATVDDVRSICLSLPGVNERLSWKQPAWFARTLMALLLLARLERLPPDELSELLQESYRLAGPLPPTV